jgi:uncharacterized membrane protein (UPF0136 family)
MNALSTAISNIYAILLIAGGIMGYMSAKSKISLITGVISGLMVLMACRIGKEKPRDGYLFVGAISLLLAIFFALRFAVNHAFMPGGLMLILSTTTLVVVGLSLFRSSK